MLLAVAVVSRLVWSQVPESSMQLVKGALFGVSSTAATSATSSTVAEVVPKALSVSREGGRATVLHLASVSATVANGCDMSHAESSEVGERSARQKLDG